MVEVLAEHGADMELAEPASSGGAKPAELAAKLPAENQRAPVPQTAFLTI